MSYSLISLENLAELKNRRGNSTNTTMATILGLTYPMVEAFSVYVWDNNSTASCDDDEIVCPVLLPASGRWYKVDLDQLPQINSDWSATSGVTQILNKPTLSTVATSGSYADLSGKPTIPASQQDSDWNSTISPTQILNKPSLSPVATSGSYNDLTSKPTIPAAQIQSDWNATTGLGTILNKPTIPNIPTNVSAFTNDVGYLTGITSGQVTTALGYTPYNSTNPNGYITGITSGNVTTALGYTPVTNARTITINGTTQDLTSSRTWNVGDLLSTGSYSNPTWITALAYSKLTGTPTTLAGYGITDGVTSSSLTSTLSGYTTNSALTTALASYATTSALTTGLAGKQNTLTLTTTGTGAATLVGSTINIPTPTIPAQFNPTAGTGISITGSYPNNTISNSAPDQTVSLTAGSNTSISGTYPNFTIGETLTTKVYKASGVVNQAIKIWSDVVTPSTSSGYSIDISSAGFTTILSANVIAIRNTTSASTSPNVSIKSQSTTAIVVNVIEDNPSTIAILGISVLSGLPSIFANVTGLSLSVTVIGY